MRKMNLHHGAKKREFKKRNKISKRKQIVIWNARIILLAGHLILFSKKKVKVEGREDENLHNFDQKVVNWNFISSAWIRETKKNPLKMFQMYVEGCGWVLSRWMIFCMYVDLVRLLSLSFNWGLISYIHITGKRIWSKI